MVLFRFSTVAGLLSTALSAVAVPWSVTSKFSTHSRRAIASDGSAIQSYHPLAKYNTYGEGIELSTGASTLANDVSGAASSFLQSHLGMASDNFKVTGTSVTETGTHVWFHQMINGIPVINSVANVAITPKNRVVALGVNFVKQESTTFSTTAAQISHEEAFAAAEKQLGAKRADVPASTQYYMTASNTAVLVHAVQVETSNGGHWYEAYVDAATGKVVGVVDFAAHVSYRVLPITKQDPTEGFELLVNPEDKNASPNGWHTVGGVTSNVTAGNNVIVSKGNPSGTQTQSAPGVFDFAFDPTKDPTDATNLALAKTNAFFVVNKIHDITYRYGFTEAMFNFQQDNLGKGGRGNDRVLVSVQDASGFNNANFVTPPDGQSGRMRMFIWTKTNPRRDGDLENDIIVHENTHGITNRMTGGGTGRCLSSLEARGLGEGWSDVMAFWTEQKNATVADYTLGSFVNTKGIRSRPYSTSKKTNPLTYQSIAGLNEPHNIGEVWANTLINVYAALVGELGFSTTAQTDPSGKQGNVVFLHLFLDALALQPCNPTVVAARAAWIQADVNRYQGSHNCTLWKAFASRGLGLNATPKFVDDATIPASCK